MNKYTVRFWVNNKRVKPSMSMLARDIRDATGQVYALLGHVDFRYTSEGGGVEVRVQSNQVTDIVLFANSETDSTAG